MPRVVAAAGVLRCAVPAMGAGQPAASPRHRCLEPHCGALAIADDRIKAHEKKAHFVPFSHRV